MISSSENPKVSILIPTYNRENYIGPCIESAQNQTYDNIEIIIVDNKSSDKTKEICTKYAAADPRILFFQNSENIGPVRNWKKCAENASGVYCKILFSDDLLMPDCISTMVSAFNSAEISLVYSSVECGLEESKTTKIYDLGEDIKLSPKDFTKKIIEGSAPVSPGAILLRTTDLRKNLHLDFPTYCAQKYTHNGAGPDVMVSLLTAIDYPFVQHISKSLTFFRIHNQSFTVENKNDTVTSGYQSAISYFLYQKMHSLWVTYITKKYAEILIRDRKLHPIRSHIKKFNGKGDFFEHASFSVCFLKILTKRIFK
jgi:glycosyltransferase involved in cell wall biosynthesis